MRSPSPIPVRHFPQETGNTDAVRVQADFEGSLNNAAQLNVPTNIPRPSEHDAPAMTLEGGDDWASIHSDEAFEQLRDGEEVNIPVSKDAIRGEKNGTRLTGFIGRAQKYTKGVVSDLRSTTSARAHEIQRNMRSHALPFAEAITDPKKMFQHKGKQLDLANYNILAEQNNSRRNSIGSFSSNERDKALSTWEIPLENEPDNHIEQIVEGRAVVLERPQESNKDIAINTRIGSSYERPRASENNAAEDSNYAKITKEDAQGYVGIKIETAEQLYNEIMKIYNQELAKEQKRAREENKTIKGIVKKIGKSAIKNAFTAATMGVTLARDPGVYWSQHGDNIHAQLNNYTHAYINNNQSLVPTEPKKIAFSIIERFIGLIKPLMDIQSQPLKDEINGYIAEAYNVIANMSERTLHSEKELRPFMKVLHATSYYARFPATVKKINNSEENRKKINDIISKYFAEEYRGAIFDFVDSLRGVSHLDLLEKDMPRPIIIAVGPSGIGKGVGFKKLLEALDAPYTILNQSKIIRDIKELINDGRNMNLKPLYGSKRNDPDEIKSSFEEIYGSFLDAYIRTGYKNGVVLIDEAENFFNTNSSVTNKLKSFLDTVEEILLQGRHSDNIPLSIKWFGIIGLSNKSIDNRSIAEKSNVLYLGNANSEQRGNMLQGRIKELNETWQKIYESDSETLYKIKNILIPTLEKLIPEIVVKTNPRVYHNKEQEQQKAYGDYISSQAISSMTEEETNIQDSQKFTVHMNARQLRSIMARIGQELIRVLDKHQSSETFMPIANTIMEKQISQQFANQEESERKTLQSSHLPNLSHSQMHRPPLISSPPPPPRNFVRKDSYAKSDGSMGE